MYALFALVLIACIAAGIAIANIIGSRNTSSNADLEQQVTQLQQQVTNLQNQLGNTQNTSPEPSTPTTPSTPSSPSIPPLTTPTSTNAQQPAIPVQTFKHAGLFIDFPAMWKLHNPHPQDDSYAPYNALRYYKIYNKDEVEIGLLHCPAPTVDPTINAQASEARSIINGTLSYVVQKRLYPPTEGHTTNWISYMTVRPKIEVDNGEGYASCLVTFSTAEKPTGTLLTQINAIYNSIR